MRRTPLAAAAVVLTTLVAPGPVEGAAHAGPAADYATAAVQATNAARAANGRKALKVDECLRGFAVKQARAMAAAEEMYHQDLGAVCRRATSSPPGRTSRTATRPAGPSWTRAG